jgi:tRNA A-37 threonylcarbamoyl transferase component Bud32
MIYKSITKNFESLVLNTKQYFDNSSNKTLFNKRNIIKLIEFEENQYVIKSFKIPHIINKIVYRFFRDSKAKRSYENSLKLEILNINTPKPIGFIEFHSTLFFYDSYYISEFFDYNFEIRDVLKDKHFKNRAVILEQFVKFTFDLHKKGVYHIDYSPGNVIIKQKENNYIFCIIDVNRMKFIEFDLDSRMKNFSKMTFDKEDNQYMIKIYSKLLKIDYEILKVKLDFYLKEQSKYLERKKRIKKLK